MVARGDRGSIGVLGQLEPHSGHRSSRMADRAKCSLAFNSFHAVAGMRAKMAKIRLMIAAGGIRKQIANVTAASPM